jgi:hypothetical protein
MGMMFMTKIYIIFSRDMIHMNAVLIFVALKTGDIDI